MITEKEVDGQWVTVYIDDETGKVHDPRPKRIDDNTTSFPLFYPWWNMETRKVEPKPATKLGNPTADTFWQVMTRCRTYNEQHPGQFPGFVFTYEMGN